MTLIIVLLTIVFFTLTVAAVLIAHTDTDALVTLPE